MDKFIAHKELKVFKFDSLDLIVINNTKYFFSKNSFLNDYF